MPKVRVLKEITVNGLVIEADSLADIHDSLVKPLTDAGAVDGDAGAVAYCEAEGLECIVVPPAAAAEGAEPVETAALGAAETATGKAQRRKKGE